MPQFERYVGIDYSGAATPTSSLPGLRVYVSDWVSPPREIPPTTSSRKHWTRHGVADWLVTQLSGQKLMLVGIDHGFSFPLQYFERHRLPPDWDKFLDDFQKHWPTDEANTYVSFLREGSRGRAAKRQGDSAWLRLTERWTATAKSVFQFGVDGQVAASTHAGLPWLRFVRGHCRDRVHFWPFDGWQIPAGRSVLAEVYPSLWKRRFPNAELSGDQHAAYAVFAWLRRTDADGSLARYLSPPLEPEERTQAQLEGWILGVT
jgi:hypothetical protein